MANTRKALHEQVIFITGATSGIGLATVRIAVAQGAKVFMVARDMEELQSVQDEMRNKGYDTAYCAADVAEFDQLQAAAEKCLTTFGRVDTWINNAGITVLGKLLDTTEEEAKRLFDTNFWGTVNGSKVAVPLLRGHGGTIINIGSAFVRAVDPLQGIYSASEHALKGFTDVLRKELKDDGSPISVSLILPGTVDTPFFEHARSKGGEVHLKKPVSAPEDVARAILQCAVRPSNEVAVGISAYLTPLSARLRPYLTRLQEGKWTPGNLFRSSREEGSVVGRLSPEGPQASSFVAAGLALTGGVLVLFRKFRLI